MPATTSTRIKLCPDCGADNEPHVKQCWTCRADLAQASEVVFAELIEEPSVKRSIWRGRLGELLFLAVGGLVIAGTFTLSTGLGMLLLVVWVVAILIILLTRPSVRTTPSALPLPPAAVAGANYFADAGDSPLAGPALPITPASAVLRQVLVTLGVVVLVIFAGFIALFVLCIGLIAAASATHA